MIREIYTEGKQEMESGGVQQKNDRMKLGMETAKQNDTGKVTEGRERWVGGWVNK